MTTVGIMSMQRIFNYGSSLQAYALRRLIESIDTSADVRYLDYRAGPTLVPSPEEGKSSILRQVSKLREYGRVPASMRDRIRFFNHKRVYASKYHPLVGIGRERSEDLNVDLQVIGSDEVFNCVQANANVGYSRDLFGHGTAARRLISYAGSFGNTTIEKIASAGIVSELGSDLRAFDAISVRDRNSQLVVEELSGQKAEVHLDPTLALPNLTQDPLIPRERQYDSKYIIVYGYAGRFTAEENAAVRKYAERNRAKVLAFGGLQQSADEFIDCDPFTLLAYFRDAEGVVSDTFHGTIFSVLSGVPFATLIRRSSGGGYGNEEKLGYLLERLGLADRRLNHHGELAEHLSAAPSEEEVSSVLRKEQQRSREYLSRWLQDGGAGR